MPWNGAGCYVVCWITHHGLRDYVAMLLLRALEAIGFVEENCCIVKVMENDLILVFLLGSILRMIL